MQIDQSVVEACLTELALEIDGEFVRQVVGEFLALGPGQVGEMEVALASGNMVRAGRAAHSLKANCATFGLGDLAVELAAFERDCREDRAEEARLRLPEIQAGFAAVDLVLGRAAERIE